MKKYLLFTFDDYQLEGGMDDFNMAFDYLEDLEEAYLDYDKAQIVRLSDMRVEKVKGNKESIISAFIKLDSEN